MGDANVSPSLVKSVLLIGRSGGDLESTPNSPVTGGDALGRAVGGCQLATSPMIRSPNTICQVCTILHRSMVYTPIEGSPPPDRGGQISNYGRLGYPISPRGVGGFPGAYGSLLEDWTHRLSTHGGMASQFLLTTRSTCKTVSLNKDSI